VFPSRDAVDALLDEYPGIGETVASNTDYAEAIGLGESAEGKA
jgi:hypothetical protein